MGLLKLTHLLVHVLLVLVITAVDRPTTADPSPSPPPSSSPSSEIQIGVILPFDGPYLWSLPLTMPAIDYAVEYVNNRPDLLPGKRLKINPGNSRCSETEGPLVAIDMHYTSRADVFLGPACDYAVAPVARFSPHWDIPIITSGALVNAFKDKGTYRLLTRIGGTYEKLGAFFNQVINEFNWGIVRLLFNDNLIPPDHGRTDCYFIMQAIFDAFKQRYSEQNISYARFDERAKPGRYEFGEMLTETSKFARVVVLCASPDSVRDIMLKAVELGFDNGEYVFFNIDLFSSKSQIEQPWYRQNDTDEQNDKAKKAYQALMTVTLRKPESEEYKIFSEEVKERARKHYGDTIYGEEEVNSFVGAFHDAVILYALALNQTLEAGFNASNGSEITERMWNTSFEGITGTVSIDENGDRNADYSLLDMDKESGIFSVVANYYGNKKVYEATNKSIHWPNRVDAPPDTPKCGFDGSGCPPDEPFPEYAIVIIVFGSLLLIVSLAAFFVYRRMQRKLNRARGHTLSQFSD